MQQHFKTQMKGHFQDIKKLMEKGAHSNSYARHFAGCRDAYGPRMPPHQRQDVTS
jgi:hypothetical protein